MGTTITFAASGVTLLTLTGDRPADGCIYDKLVGWYGVNGVDLGMERRPNAAGAFAPLQSFPDARAISIEGQYFGPDRPTSLAMRETLAGLYLEGRELTMTVADDLRTTSRVVFVDTVDIPWTIHREFPFSIDVKAPDPKRYASTAVAVTPLQASGTGMAYPEVYPLDYGTPGANGRLVAANPGNAETTTRYLVTGGSMPDGFVIVNLATGARLTYVGPVNAGDTIIVDTVTRTASINSGGPGSRFLASPEWWNVPAKTSLELQFLARGAVTGTPTLTAYTAPAFY